jgi:uncharacterized protein (TIGR02996 family)
MNTLDALLAGIVADPLEETRWLVLADWLQENDDPRRAELLRLHRKMLATCCEPDAHPERAAWQARMVELLAAGVRPCVPQKRMSLGAGADLSFNFVPPGSFIMGSREDEENRLSGEDRHRVNVPDGFYLGTFPVTQGQWQAVTNTNPSRFPGDLNRPVEQVSWDDCVNFCSRLGEVDGLRACLPTEEAWEYACRAGTTTQFHFGETLSAAQANYDLDHAQRRAKGWGDTAWWGTTPVDRFPPNPWGLYDLHGNVWEWCQDWYEGFPSSLPDVFPPHGPFRGLRGGGWQTYPAICRSGRRNRQSPGSGFHAYGCRICLWPAEPACDES